MEYRKISNLNKTISNIVKTTKQKLEQIIIAKFPEFLNKTTELDNIIYFGYSDNYCPSYAVSRIKVENNKLYFHCNNRTVDYLRITYLDIDNIIEFAKELEDYYETQEE